MFALSRTNALHVVVPSVCRPLVFIFIPAHPPPLLRLPGIETQEKAEASEEETLGGVPGNRELKPQT